eukprot:4668711-Prymnesium_polylepis.2
MVKCSRHMRATTRQRRHTVEKMLPVRWWRYRGGANSHSQSGSGPRQCRPTEMPDNPTKRPTLRQFRQSGFCVLGDACGLTGGDATTTSGAAQRGRTSAVSPRRKWDSADASTNVCACHAPNLGAVPSQRAFSPLKGGFPRLRRRSLRGRYRKRAQIARRPPPAHAAAPGQPMHAALAVAAEPRPEAPAQAPRVLREEQAAGVRGGARRTAAAGDAAPSVAAAGGRGASGTREYDDTAAARAGRARDGA